MKESILKDRKITFLGDSITESCGASKKDNGFVYRIKDKTQAQVTELGIGGTRIAYKSVPTITDPIFDCFYETRLYQIPKDTELLVVFGGTNDFDHGNAPLGKMGDKTIYTFYGALDSLINKIKLLFPDTKVVFATPIHREIETSDKGELVDFVNAIKDVCSEYKIPVIDLYNLYKIYPSKEEDKLKYVPDGLHPNDLGHDILADVFIEELEKLF